MSDTHPKDSSSGQAHGLPWGLVFLWGLPLFVWALWCWRLRVDWTMNPQYVHGWIVPAAAVVLLWLRWFDRPPPEASKGRLFPLIMIGATLALFPVELAFKANPDWRAPHAVWALLALVITLASFAHRGG